MRRLPWLLGVLAICVYARSASAQVLYAAIGDDSGNGLYTVDPLTSSSTLVGPITMGVTQLGITGLAIHPLTGVMYGVTTGNPTQLVTIDPATGNATLIGNVSPNAVPDITFSADGRLFGWQKGISSGALASPSQAKSSGRRSLAPQQGVLLQIDIATGAGTPVGSPQSISTMQGCGLTELLGVFYLSLERGSGFLRTVDPSTGVTTTGPTMNGPNSPLAALASSPAGVLYAASNNGDLITINPSTGAVTAIGSNLPSGTDALVFTNSALGAGALLNVPAVSHAGLLVLGAVLAVAGALLVRFR